MAHSDCGWTWGCTGKTARSLQNMRHTWALLRWSFTKRCYTKCTYLLINAAKLCSKIKRATTANLFDEGAANLLVRERASNPVGRFRWTHDVHLITVCVLRWARTRCRLIRAAICTRLAIACGWLLTRIEGCLRLGRRIARLVRRLRMRRISCWVWSLLRLVSRLWLASCIIHWVRRIGFWDYVCTLDNHNTNSVTNCHNNLPKQQFKILTTPQFFDLDLANQSFAMFTRLKLAEITFITLLRTSRCWLVNGLIGKNCWLKLIATVTKIKNKIQDIWSTRLTL